MKLKTRFKWFLVRLFRLIPDDGPVFYRQFKGRPEFLACLLKNALNPRRIWKKFSYGQVVPLPVAISKGTALPKEIESAVRGPALEKALSDLRRDGVALMEGFIPEEVCDQILEMNKQDERVFKATQTDQYRQIIGPVLDKTLVDLWLNPGLLGVLGSYAGRQPYARIYPSLTTTLPNYDQPHTSEITDLSSYDRGLAVPWHYDAPNLYQFAVLLGDTTKEDSHMQVLAGTHRIHHQNMNDDDTFLSDDAVDKYGFRAVDCIGPKGTVIFFDANAYHRLWAKKGSKRHWIKFEFTPGNSIMHHTITDRDTLPDPDGLLGDLLPGQRETLAGLYPGAIASKTPLEVIELKLDD